MAVINLFPQLSFRWDMNSGMILAYVQQWLGETMDDGI